MPREKRHVRFAFLCAAIALGACSRSPSTPRGGSGSSSAAVSSAASASTAPTLGAPPLPDGCWMEVERGTEPAALSKALRAACAPGTRALVGGRKLELVPGKQAELEFETPAGGGCVRVIATAPREVVDLELELLDRAGRSLAKDSLIARFALLGERGPVCVSPGSYKLVLAAKSGSGAAQVEVLIAAGDAG